MRHKLDQEALSQNYKISMRFKKRFNKLLAKEVKLKEDLINCWLKKRKDKFINVSI